MTFRESTVLLLAALLILAAWALSGDLMPTHHCEIDAPMEQAQCRATRGERPEWLVRK